MRSSRREFLGKTIRGAATASLGGRCSRPGLLPRRAAGRPHAPSLLDKWDGFEGDAMRAVVKDFNDSQNRITVHYTPVGVIDRKLLAATSGGDPPDLAGCGAQCHALRRTGALTPLDGLMKRDDVGRDHWIEAYVNICTHQDIMWPCRQHPSPAPCTTTWPCSRARLTNSGPRARSQPRPATLAELDAYAEALTKYDASATSSTGFSAQEPAGSSGVGFWFGAG